MSSKKKEVNELRVIAITHKAFSLDQIGQLHIPDDSRAPRLQKLKESLELKELMFLSTCNRIEIIFTLDHYLCPGTSSQLLTALYPEVPHDIIASLSRTCDRFNGDEAAQHLLEVASSMDSVIIGEREIITQLRKAYEECLENELTGDTIRLTISQCVRTAKEVFTHTDLVKKPVSAVSLAWREFSACNLPLDARVLLIGAGQIIRNFAKFLHEYKYTSLVFANRTLEHAQSLSKQYGGEAIALNEVSAIQQPFDVMVVCTAADHVILSKSIFNQIQGDSNRCKLLIDLALPFNIDPEISADHGLPRVDMHVIQERAQANIEFREQALTDCVPIIQQGKQELSKLLQARRVEQAMQSIPETIKEIKQTALGVVFAKELEQLDDQSKKL
ncbi:MAG: glutamyl-tRNA reductase, partial [Flavobacteriales bacterium]